MIKTGIDTVEIARFEQMRNRERFLKRVFNPDEVAYCTQGKNPAERIAGHFAAKEAFSKFLGTGIRGFAWRDIEIRHDALGKPHISFLGQTCQVDLSITHSKTVACAVVCGDDQGISAAAREYLKAYRAFLPKRKPDMHKGDCGHVLVIAGSKGMTGAACLAAEAALRTGSGLVTAAAPASEQPVLAAKLTEAMTLPLPCAEGVLSLEACAPILAALENCDVCVIGPGLGRCAALPVILKELFNQKKPVVLDADGINALSTHIDIGKVRACDLVLTPHPGEMARLTGKTVQEIESAREETAREFAESFGATLLLKGHRTVIASPEGAVHVNQTGNSGMASGGMGDVLSGVIGSLIGQGAPPYDAAVLGAFLHGLAGDMAADRLGEHSLLARDVIDTLPQAIRALGRT